MMTLRCTEVIQAHAIVGMGFAVPDDLSIVDRRRLLAEHWMENEAIGRRRNEWNGTGPLFEIIMPCGHTFQPKAMDDMPTRDLPCTCGSPRHYFVKWFDPRCIEQERSDEL
jgi:hypothetical protein